VPPVPEDPGSPAGKLFAKCICPAYSCKESAAISPLTGNGFHPGCNRKSDLLVIIVEVNESTRTVSRLRASLMMLIFRSTDIRSRQSDGVEESQ
jgi:hypothetical protein